MAPSFVRCNDRCEPRWLIFDDDGPRAIGCLIEPATLICNFQLFDVAQSSFVQTANPHSTLATFCHNFTTSCRRNIAQSVLDGLRKEHQERLDRRHDASAATTPAEPGVDASAAGSPSLGDVQGQGDGGAEGCRTGRDNLSGDSSESNGSARQAPGVAEMAGIREAFPTGRGASAAALVAPPATTGSESRVSPAGSNPEDESETEPGATAAAAAKREMQTSKPLTSLKRAKLEKDNAYMYLQVIGPLPSEDKASFPFWRIVVFVVRLCVCAFRVLTSRV